MSTDITQENINQDDQIVKTIDEIDNQIAQLYKNLEAISAQSNPDLNKQNQMLAKITEMQQLKSTLYQTLNSNYASMQANVIEGRNSLVNEVAVGGIIKNELQNANKNLNALKTERNNKLRMAEINDYYSSKYATQTDVLKRIVYFCVPILILAVLLKQELIPENIGKTLIGILVFIGVIVVFLQVIDILNRDNMVFDEYKFPFDPENVDLSSSSNDNDQPSDTTDDSDWDDYLYSCIGEDCCPEGNTFGTVWDATTKKCVTPEYESQEDQNNTDSEGFVGARCTKNIFGKSGFNVNIFKNNSKVVKGFDEKNNNYATF